VPAPALVDDVGPEQSGVPHLCADFVVKVLVPLTQGEP
jgi:hypothetical protein